MDTILTLVFGVIYIIVGRSINKVEMTKMYFKIFKKNAIYKLWELNYCCCLAYGFVLFEFYISLIKGDADLNVAGVIVVFMLTKFGILEFEKYYQVYCDICIEKNYDIVSKASIHKRYKKNGLILSVIVLCGFIVNIITAGK